MNNNLKIELHARLCDEIHKLYVNKNSDYGDSFSKVRSEYPEAIAIRLMDKLERVKQLLKQDYQVKVTNESLDDNLIDLANYCLLELVERKWERHPMQLADTRTEPAISNPQVIDRLFVDRGKLQEPKAGKEYD